MGPLIHLTDGLWGDPFVPGCLGLFPVLELKVPNPRNTFVPRTVDCVMFVRIKYSFTCEVLHSASETRHSDSALVGLV